jgi:mono/diheme cytochrome c family protein
LLIVIVILAIAEYTYLKVKFPDVGPAPDMKITATPEMMERGKYLANGFAGCTGCHSTRDFSKLGGPIIPGTEGKGGEDIGELMKMGNVPAKNITSDKETGIGSWTDGEIYRAVTMGVSKDGEPLAPVMPYPGFAQMDENDIKSIIVYIRTLPPINNKVQNRELPFPFSLIVRTIPDKPKFGKFPDISNKVGIGQYYSGACMECHAPMEKGKFIMEKFFAGGVEFPAPKGGVVRSGNLTPDKETGIGGWTKEQFLQKFKDWRLSEKQIPVKQGEFSTIMPWPFFAQLKDEDLGSIYDFLMTLKPVKNKVEKWSAVVY